MMETELGGSDNGDARVSERWCVSSNLQQSFSHFLASQADAFFSKVLAAWWRR